MRVVLGHFYLCYITLSFLLNVMSISHSPWFEILYEVFCLPSLELSPSSAEVFAKLKRIEQKQLGKEQRHLLDYFKLTLLRDFAKILLSDCS